MSGSPATSTGPGATSQPPPAAAAPRAAEGEPAREFDPYYTWLGIPPARQPPNHYQLLGITDFEQNPDVITNAADRPMTHLRSFAGGPHSAYSQQLLNEVAAARICLRNPQTKFEYDQSLRVAETQRGAPPVLPEMKSEYDPPIEGAQRAIRAPQVPPPATVPPYVPLAASGGPGPFDPPTPQQVPSMLLPEPAQSAHAAPATKPRTSNVLARRRSRHREASKYKAVRQAISIVIGGAMGCAIGWFVAFVLVPRIQERLAQRRQIENSNEIVSRPRDGAPASNPKRAPATAPRPVAKANRPSSATPKATSKPGPSEPKETREQRIARKLAASAAQAKSSGAGVAEEPSVPLMNSRVESPAAVKPSPPSHGLASLPTDVDLPPMSAQQSALRALNAVPKDIEIELASDLIALDSAYKFVAEKDAASSVPQWQIYLRKTWDAGTQEAVVAYLSIVNDSFTFRWAEDAMKLSAGQLRNCLMQLKSGDATHQIALRSPLRPEATSLPLEKEKFREAFEIDDLPREEYLRLDVRISYDGFTPPQASPLATHDRGSLLRRLDVLYTKIGRAAVDHTVPNAIQRSQAAAHSAIAARRAAASALSDGEARKQKATGGVELVQASSAVARARTRADQSRVQAEFACLVLGRECVTSGYVPPGLQQQSTEALQLRAARGKPAADR